jgi:hypothetical protein
VAGKPKKLALTACIRKLLTILNVMVKMGQHWTHQVNSPGLSRRLLDIETFPPIELPSFKRGLYAQENPQLIATNHEAPCVAVNFSSHSANLSSII